LDQTKIRLGVAFLSLSPCHISSTAASLLRDFFLPVQIIDRGKHKIHPQNLFWRFGHEFPVLLNEAQFATDPATRRAGCIQFGFGLGILRFRLALPVEFFLPLDPLLGGQAALVDENIIDRFIRAVFLQVNARLASCQVVLPLR
jgi:hypothetical protein